MGSEPNQTQKGLREGSHLTVMLCDGLNYGLFGRKERVPSDEAKGRGIAAVANFVRLGKRGRRERDQGSKCNERGDEWKREAPRKNKGLQLKKSLFFEYRRGRVKKIAGNRARRFSNTQGGGRRRGRQTYTMENVGLDTVQGGLSFKKVIVEAFTPCSVRCGSVGKGMGEAGQLR